MILGYTLQEEVNFGKKMRLEGSAGYRKREALG